MAGYGKFASPQDSIQQVSTQLPSTYSGGDRFALDAFSFQSSRKPGGASAQMGGGSYTNYFEDHLARLHADIEHTTRKLELEQRRLAKIDKDLASAETEFQTKRSKYKQKATGREVDRLTGCPVVREERAARNEKQTSQEDAVANKTTQVRRPERQLELEIASFNQANAHNDQLRDNIDQLRKERQLLDNVFRKMEKGIRGSRRAIDDLNSTINEDRSGQDDAKQKCSALGKMLERDRRGFHEKTEELKKGIREEAEKAKEQELLSRVGGLSDQPQGKGARRKTYMVADEEEAFSESAMHRRILKISFLNTIQRRHIKQHQKNIEVFEQAFSTIKSSTGIVDIGEIVRIFVDLEQKNFSLLTYVNQLNREIESTVIANRVLQDQLEGRQKGELNSESRKSSALSEITTQITKTHASTKEKIQEGRELTKILGECRPHIQGIVKYLKEEIPNLVSVGYEGDSPQMKSSPPDDNEGVDDEHAVPDSLLDHLTYIEEALMLFRACLPPDAQRIWAQPKLAAGTRAKHPSDLPSANFTGDDDDEDDDTGQSESRPWTRKELAAKAEQNIARRRRKPGQQGKLPHEERQREMDDTPGERSQPSKDNPGQVQSDPAAANGSFSKSPSILAGGAPMEDAGGREDMWWRGQGQKKK